MEQKAVVYKTIKGMARDMALSSGSNEFSYENYNVRITTRGNEDSLIVTNEKGTESNIIASRSVQKTVNTIFEGQHPDFTTGDKTETILSSSTDTIGFGYNTEYNVAGLNTENEVLIKTKLSIDEQPTTYMGEQYLLLNNGHYEGDKLFTIPGGYNSHTLNTKLKDILLGGSAGYYESNNSNDCTKNDQEVIIDPDYKTVNPKLPTDASGIKDNWSDSYKYLYNKMIERKFNLYPFNINAYKYSFVDSIRLEYLNQNIADDNTQFTLARKGNDDFYVLDNLKENNEDDDYWVEYETNGFEFINGTTWADKYPTGTSLDLKQQTTYKLRVNVTRPVPDDYWTSSDTSNPNPHGSEPLYHGYYNQYAGTLSEVEAQYSGRYLDKSAFKISAGYLEISFNFDINDYFDAGYKEDTRKDATSILMATSVSELNADGLSCYLNYSRYSTSSYSPCFSLNIQAASGWTTGSYGMLYKKIGDITYSFTAYGGPFYPYNVNIVQRDNANATYFKSIDTSVVSCKNYYTRSGSGTELSPYVYTIVASPTGNPSTSNYYEQIPYNIVIGNSITFIETAEHSVATHNFSSIYKFKDFSGTYSLADTDGVTVSTSDGINFVIGSTNYSNKKYALTTTDVTSNSKVTTIYSQKDGEDENIYLELYGVYNELKYNNLSGVLKFKNISDNNYIDYVILKITSDAYTVPFVVFVKKTEYENLINSNTQIDYSNGYDIYMISSGAMSLATFTSMIKSDMSGKAAPINVTITSTTSSGVTTYSSNTKIFKISGEPVIGYKVNDELTLFAGNTKIEKVNELPILKTNSNTTTIQSEKRQLYIYPTYDKVLSTFGFTQDKFTSDLEYKGFRVKHSNNDWDSKYLYRHLDSVDDNTDYIIDVDPPYYALDTNVVKFDVVGENGIYKNFTIDIINNENSYFGSGETIYITIKDTLDSTYSKNVTVSSNYIEVVDANLNNHLLSKHEFYISSISDYSSEPTLEEEEIEQEIVYIANEEIGKEYTITHETLKHTSGSTITEYLREIIDNDGKKTICTFRYDFTNAGYQNKFYSLFNISIRKSNFGEYHALTIPGRILGSCTIEEYAVLFFHYSSPALKFYTKSGDTYTLVDSNAQIDKTITYYTKRRGVDIYDEAIIKGILQRDDNNDYINGKNKDYIVRLKYINAKPDNKENEFFKIVNKIANAATQSQATTTVIEKKPYYAADILWSGDLGFNANHGIETIGYYESNDVIKVYWTDGLNQPRMINIMTPKELRSGVDCVWDNKTFDFIQEINGEEKCEITKKFGGGAFPAGSVQYYFTYSNLGGCETNPFICSPIYYTSQSEKGDSPTKITNNTFEIILSNLSNRFDYVNIYSVVRSTKDAQPYCKKVIYLSIKNKKTVKYTDNNLLGEVVDHTYLLMLQGTPISALTMAEKDNTLFLGNINKLQKSLSSEEKQKIKTYFTVNQKLREYQNYSPDEENWYENRTKGDKISIDGNSSDIKTFMFNEYYRLGIQFQDKFGKWTDPIFIQDVKCDLPIKNELRYTEGDDNTYNVNKLKSFIPYFSLVLNKKDENDFYDIINKYEYVRIRPVIVYPNISSRNVLCQGLLNPTMFNYSDRSVNGPFNFSSYFFRPYPPAISDNVDESGDYKFNINPDIAKQGGYPIEYRHGYPITGWHDIIEEALASGDNIDAGGTIGNMVSNYLAKKPTTFVRLTVNTAGWWVNSSAYLREGTLILDKNGGDIEVTYKKGGKLYQVSSKSNRGHLDLIDTINADTTDDNYNDLSSDVATTKGSANNAIGKMLSFFSGGTDMTDKYVECYGFNSHIHYFKNSFLYFLIISIEDVVGVLTDKKFSQNEIIKSISDTRCWASPDGFVFNEGSVTYKAQYPVTIKITPLSKVTMRKHRGLKRKNYACDILVTSDKIEMSTSNNGDKYIDDGGLETDVAKKAYYSLNNGEIQCANGNKSYNIFEGSAISKVDEDYGSAEIDAAQRKQSLFYVDESVCTLNSPEIEYNPTVQKIDLSNYKLNIVGAANITGYKNNIVIDNETPPVAFGNVVGQGFRHEQFEIQNFNTEAYRYMLSGAYWYDSYFMEGDEEEGEKPNDDTSLLSDQYCWWVYPFNRQILNNSHEGRFGKCRTKKWVNYHYSAFSDYFGNASIDYKLMDAKQIYDNAQSVNLDTIWQKDKAVYFGSCDTAYTNPVPLVGILGGSSEPEENAYEQSLAVSPHCGFKSEDSYTSANLADIVPFSFNSTNHFVLSLDAYKQGIANVFPNFYTDENLLSEIRDITNSEYYEYRYEFEYDNVKYRATLDPLRWVEGGPMINIYKLDSYQTDGHTVISLHKTISNNVTTVGFVGIETNVPAFSPSLIHVVNPDEQCGFIYTDNVLTSVAFRKVKVYNDNGPTGYTDFENDRYKSGVKTRERGYNIPSSLILDSTKPVSCAERYVHFDIDRTNFERVSNDTVKNYGIYDYGHIYIAQLERGVTSADQVFNGTEESVLLQNTWIPAGSAIDIIKFKIEGLKYTEGDSYYQRYDCMKTYANTSAAINQNIEVLSAMIQTRLNLDGIYSYRGSVDNVDMNNTNTNLLNTAYSQDDNYFTYSITNSYIADITEYSNMFTWTLTKQPMSSTDNWMAVNLIAYFNATGSFGKITRIINYRNQLFCFQNNAISQIAYNERVALSASDGVPIEIGNSGKVQGLNYISSNVGCQNRWSVMPSKGFLYWVDDRRAEIYRFGESLEPFSTAKGFSDWVKANTYGEDWKPIKSTNVPITTYYDNNNDDIYFVTEKDCLAYNEKIDAFESFFSYEDSFILNSAGNTIVIKEQDSLIKENTDIYEGSSWWNNGIRGDGLSAIEIMHEGEYNRFFGVQMPFYIRFKVYPEDMQRDKIYTNLEFNLDAFNKDDFYVPDDTFTRVRIWNEYQWGQWELEEGINNLYGTTAYKKRFRTHYLQLPRASYYPNGYYENYNTMFYRMPMWNKWASGATIDSRNLVLRNMNSSTINDRIRNPWVWLELYKKNESFVWNKEVTESNYFKLKNNLFIQQFNEVNKEDWGNYYNNEEESLYKIVDEQYVKEDNTGSDRQPSITEIQLADRHNYSLEELYYKDYNNEYQNASEDMLDNEEITIYKLEYNKLYSLSYKNCANIYNFASDVDYYELLNDNNRIEIHDIIVKYFEA